MTSRASGSLGLKEKIIFSTAIWKPLRHWISFSVWYQSKFFAEALMKDPQSFVDLESWSKPPTQSKVWCFVFLVFFGNILAKVDAVAHVIMVAFEFIKQTAL